jgi:aminoacrylate hydrolase
MPFAELTDGGRIHYTVAGEGPPVVLIAGMGGAGNYWQPQVAPFSAKYSVICYDQRGSGQSSKDEVAYSVPQMAEELLAVLNAAKIEKAHLIGHAAGAVIGEALALQHPDRVASLVLFGGWARIDPYFRRAFEIRKDLLRNSGRLAYVRSMPIFLNTPAYVSRNIAKIEAAEPAAAEHLSPTPILLSRIDAFCAYEPGEKLRQIACPTLVCAAMDDHLVPLHCAQELTKLIPGAVEYYFETGGHSVPHEDPAAFDAIVLSFLDAAVAGRRWTAPPKGARS